MRLLSPVMIASCLASCTGVIASSGMPGGGSGGSGGGSGSGSGSSGSAGSGTSWLAISGPNIVDDQGHTVRLTGINWFGLETANYAPHGLWQRSMDAFLDQIVQLGFNVIRVPISSELFDAGSTPNGIDFTQNPDLVGLTGPQILDVLITKARANGLRVFLDRHRPDSGAQSALWYTAQYPESRWISDLVALATKYKGDPTVIGFDLHNEPHSPATWGDNNLTTDWRLAAERAGNAVLAANPNALIIVEGVDIYNNISYWWGGNLRGAPSAPVQLSVPDHLIYSTHDYPASVYNQSWFTDPTYPANLPALWDATWGGLSATTPVLVGEFGTLLQTTSDQQWLQALTQYIKTKGLSFTFWCLNPDSGDTGGILADDWTTVNQDKMSYLTPILAPLLPVAP